MKLRMVTPDLITVPKEAFAVIIGSANAPVFYALFASELAAEGTAKMLSGDYHSSRVVKVLTDE